MSGAQQVRGIANGLVGEHFQTFGLDFEDFAALEFDGGDEVGSEQAVGGLVLA